MCRECGLSFDDLENMTMGMALDYIDEYIEMKNPNNKKNEPVYEYADEVTWL